MKGNIKIGQHVIPLWLIVVLSVSGIVSAVVGNYIWETITIDLEVEEPLEIISYPDELNLFPGETKEFNITVMNHASVNYAITLDFSLDNETYQDDYVTFSQETYIIVPSQQNISAWLEVEKYAPPIKTSLVINFRRIAEHVLFFDDFNNGVADDWTEHLGTWNVIDGEYFVTVGVVENGISTVDDLTLTDCVIEAKLRFTDAVGFRAGIVFRYTDNEHYYAFEISNEYDEIYLAKYPVGGIKVSYPINSNTNYFLRVEINGNTFNGYLDGQEILSWTDGTYTTGKVGLRARRADVFFDDFAVTGRP